MKRTTNLQITVIVEKQRYSAFAPSGTTSKLALGG